MEENACSARDYRFGVTVDMRDVPAHRQSHCGQGIASFWGAGYIKVMVVERVFRESRATRIFEGANEIQRNMLAKHLLKS